MSPLKPALAAIPIARRSVDQRHMNFRGLHGGGEFRGRLHVRTQKFDAFEAVLRGGGDAIDQRQSGVEPIEIGGKTRHGDAAFKNRRRTPRSSRREKRPGSFDPGQLNRNSSDYSAAASSDSTLPRRPRPRPLTARPTKYSSSATRSADDRARGRSNTPRTCAHSAGDWPSSLAASCNARQKEGSRRTDVRRSESTRKVRGRLAVIGGWRRLLERETGMISPSQ